MKRNIIYWVSLLVVGPILFRSISWCFTTVFEYITQEPDICWHWSLRLVNVITIGLAYIIFVGCVIEWLKEIIYKVRK